MGFRKLLVVLFISLAHAWNDCPTSRCDRKGIAIKPPFWLQEGQKHLSCKPPGFNLSCNSNNIAILNLPHAGEFYVSSIFYNEKTVILHDSEDCLPRRLLSLNLSSSPFTALSYQTYMFFICPKAKARPHAATIINCLSNTTTDVIATRYASDNILSMYCKKLATVPVPIGSGFYELPNNLELTWNQSTCKDCGSTTGAAEKQHNTHTMIMLSVVTSALVVPAMIASISCCICMVRRDNSQVSDTNQTAGGGGVASLGLDKSTIETYRMITVGESRRIEGPNDATCTICLADYAPNEAIRFMPECEHCFHVECIDEWLSINNKCPVCRNSQTPVDSC